MLLASPSLITPHSSSYFIRVHPSMAYGVWRFFRIRNKHRLGHWRLFPRVRYTWLMGRGKTISQTRQISKNYQVMMRGKRRKILLAAHRANQAPQISRGDRQAPDPKVFLAGMFFFRQSPSEARSIISRQHRSNPFTLHLEP